MRAAILIILSTLVLSACASKEHVTQTPAERHQQEEFTFRESQASRLR